MKHTKVTDTITNTNPINSRGGNYVFERGEWWCINAYDGGKRRAKVAQNIQNTRMWVNGEYISKLHPLHKAGRYKSFEAAAFSSLKNYATSTEGQVYIITNPAWEGWVKVGMAVDASDRLKSYQTSSPLRDYQVLYIYNVSDRRKSEAEVHRELSLHFEQKNEWFKCSPETAQRFVESVLGN